MSIDTPHDKYFLLSPTQVSCDFCERHLRLLFTIIEQTPHEAVKLNLIKAAGDLCVRFPNVLEPWTSRLYGR